MSDEQRLMIFMVSDRDILTAVTSIGEDMPDHVQFRKIPTAPAGAKIVSVHYNHRYRCFDFIVEHETFLPVAPGVRIPVAGEGIHEMEVISIAIQRVQQ